MENYGSMSTDDQEQGRHHGRRPSARSYSSQKSSDERSALLDVPDALQYRRNYASVPGTPRPRITRHLSATSPQAVRTSKASLAASFTQRLTKALSNHDLKAKRDEPDLDERVWYDQVSFWSGARHAACILPVDVNWLELAVCRMCRRGVRNSLDRTRRARRGQVRRA